MCQRAAWVLPGTKSKMYHVVVYVDAVRKKCRWNIWADVGKDCLANKIEVLPSLTPSPFQLPQPPIISDTLVTVIMNPLLLASPPTTFLFLQPTAKPVFGWPLPLQVVEIQKNANTTTNKTFLSDISSVSNIGFGVTRYFGNHKKIISKKYGKSVRASCEF